MNGFRFVKGAAVSLAALGVVCPQVSVLADTKAPARSISKAPQTVTVPDIALTTGGTFSGRVVDHTGKVLEGAQVSLRQGKNEIAKTVTNKEGLYSFKNLRGGVYQVGSGNTEGVFRVWSEKTAPPAAKEHALLVMGENGARGQTGAIDPTLVLLTGGTIATVVISAITLNRVNDIDDKVDLIPLTP